MAHADSSDKPSRPSAVWTLLVIVVLALMGAATYFLTRDRGGREEKISDPAQPVKPEASSDSALAKGKELYANYCAQCHGDKGEGDGPAAKFLFPKPRNFTENLFRIVSTDNRVPTDQDLMQVITQGMPGSAMFPFGNLSEGERKELVAYVRFLTRSSYEDRYRKQVAEEKQQLDLQDMAQTLDAVLIPGHAVPIPAALPPRGPEAIARGAAIYKTTCAPCHGVTGKGDGVQDQKNADGTPTRPRDFTRGIFKGGRDFAQLFHRVWIGMPGSPMPASNSDLKPDQVADVLQYVLSLSNEAAQGKVEHRRALVAAKKSESRLDGEIPNSVWVGAGPVSVVVSPLWWREYPEPDLKVQALHDGQTLAIRLTWNDATRNDRIVRIQDFEDMAAVQLFKGAREPFIGMGMADRAVDVWLWRASWSGNPATYSDVDNAYPNMEVDMYPLERRADGGSLHALGQQPPGFITADAVGNLRSDFSARFSAHNLEAKGVGTMTMRPKLSQLVAANGVWKDGHWTVVLKRPLQSKAADTGISLMPGDTLSIAVAIWDGAARDRNGQKLVSIWHDLKLE